LRHLLFSFLFCENSNHHHDEAFLKRYPYPYCLQSYLLVKSLFLSFITPKARQHTDMSLPTTSRRRTVGWNMNMCRLFQSITALTTILVLSLQCIVPSHAFAFSPSLVSHPIRYQGPVSSLAVQQLYAPAASHRSTSITTSQNKYHRSTNKQSLIRLQSTPTPTPEEDGDELFNGRTTATLVAVQSLLVVVAIIAAAIVKTPNWGLGPNINFSVEAIATGTLLALPLGGFAAALDLVEERLPALKDVSKATQRSILALLGGTFKPVLGLVTAIGLGLAAGVGEEMLFRGVLQYELVNRWGPIIGVGISSLVFGALHAVTPLYAALAGIASVYFGALYLWTDNLAIPITCHAFYDVCALMYAHYEVSRLPTDERNAIANWDGPESNDA
jgi:membrane protease YdiL (CAAX protease family)